MQYFLFLRIENSVFRQHLLIVFHYFHLFFKDCIKKIIIQTCKMIKNKTPNIKIIKNKVKNILDFQTNFYSTKYQRTICKNYS